VRHFKPLARLVTPLFGSFDPLFGLFDLVFVPHSPSVRRLDPVEERLDRLVLFGCTPGRTLGRTCPRFDCGVVRREDVRMPVVPRLRPLAQPARACAWRRT